jgi:SecD/SecF fusion protein
MFNWLTDNPTLLNTLTVAALVLGAWLLGAWMGKAVRMPDYGWKFSLILFAVFSAIVVIYRGWPPKLGIDLGGGAILVYRVNPTATDWRPEKMDSLVAAIGERVNPGGQKEISVRSLGTDMVQIIMPAVGGADAEKKKAEMDEVKRIISKTGALEFRIVATHRFDESLIESAAASRKAAWEKAPGPNNNDGRVYPDPKTGKKEKAEWCRVRIKDGKEVENFKYNPGIAPATIQLSYKDKDGNEITHTEVLVMAPDSPSSDVTGKDLRNAQASQDQENGGFEIAFRFSPDGGLRFGNLTRSHLPLDHGAFKYDLAIVLDNYLQTAPTIDSAITDSGRITTAGGFEQKYADEMADIINRGSLPAALFPTPEREMITDPTLGVDTIRQSLYAMGIAAIVVPLFMLIYYRFAGLVAVIVLALTVLMLVAIMVLIKAPFTLTALAGLALSVGMEVDNNVLIYERLREELHHGAALRMALRNSFHRVGVVIVDANVTHVLAAAVLFYVGTEQVKGFAITFLLGALLSIWATMFVARTLFEVSERRRWVRQINMMQLIGHTKIDFMHWFPVCATFSVLITVLGVAVAVTRGKGLFDIDFTGGTSVQTVFRQPEDIKTIRTDIDKYETEHKDSLPGATVTNIYTDDNERNRRFVINTANSDGDAVKKLIEQLFAGKLVNANLTYEVSTAPSKPSPSEKPQVSPSAKTTAPHPVEPKPAEPPVDMSVPKPEAKPAGTAPTRAPPAAPRSTAADPSESKAKKVGWTSKPVPLASRAIDSSSELPPASLVAMAGAEAFLLAQAESPKTTANAKPPAAAVGTGSKPEAKFPAATAAKSETNPETKPADKPAAKAVPKPEDKSAAKASPPSVKSAAPPPAKSEAAEAIQAVLSFKVGEKTGAEANQGARYEREQLLSIIDEALEANKISPKSVVVELSNEKDAAVSEKWNATFTPVAGKNARLTQAIVADVLNRVQSEVAKQPYFPGVDKMGTAVAGDTRFWACVALVLSWSLIIVYLWVRFQGVAFGLAAVIALIHDVLVMLGAIAFSSYLALIPGVSAVTLIEPFKIDLTIVAAFLTIIGYSVNDTIVVFDRIREIRGKSPTLTRQMVNDATNQTLSRTVLTSATVLAVVLILYIFGGQAVHGFAFALFIGVLTGTYSSIYVAAPILLWLLHPKEMKAGKSSSEAA